MKNKKILISIAIAAVIAIVAVVIFVVKPFGTTNDDTNKPVASTAPADDEIIDYDAQNKTLDELTKTKQYADALKAENSTFYAQGDIGNTNPVYGILGAYTVNKYVEDAIENPYFATGWWKTKDEYTAGSIKTYITPYVSEELNAKYLEAAKEPESEAFNSFYTGKVSMPDPALQVAPNCYDTWDAEACAAFPPQITDMTITGLSDTSVKITATVSMQLLYQKPDSPEGNLISQDRDYKLEFVLSEKNKPASNDTEVPIMIIDDISASLEIKGNTDYLINVEE